MLSFVVKLSHLLKKKRIQYAGIGACDAHHASCLSLLNASTIINVILATGL